MKKTGSYTSSNAGGSHRGALLVAFVALFGTGCGRPVAEKPRSIQAVETAKPSEMDTRGVGNQATGAEGDRQSSVPLQGQREVAIVAGGCFWGVEEILRQHPGVLDTVVGYTGGSTPDPGYDDVKKGDSGHAEAVRIEFDNGVVSYGTLLRYFFRLHDPTTLNRQGNDRGTQYRSAIFVLDEEQRRIAEAVKAEVDRSGKWDSPVVTEIVSAGAFFEAEQYHQDYLQRYPNGYTCHYLRD